MQFRSQSSELVFQKNFGWQLQVVVLRLDRPPGSVLQSNEQILAAG